MLFNCRKKVTSSYPLPVILFVFLLLVAGHGHAQSFGLGFNGNEVVQDKRTGLNLFPQSSYATGRGVVEIRFDMSFLHGYVDYFGYITRLVINNQWNIDLLYDKNPVMQNQFRFIIGDSVSPPSFNIDTARLFTAWTSLRLVMDMEKGLFSCYRDQQLVVQMDLPLQNTDSLRLFFGAHHYRNFYNTDVPAMQIRDITILKNGRTDYHFPLDERTGNKVHAVGHPETGLVENPVWIRNIHYAWRSVADLTLNGPCSVAFDSAAGQLYLFGVDSVVKLSVGDRTQRSLAYRSGKQPFLPGNQSLYAATSGGIYNFYIDQRLAGLYDPALNTWNVHYRPGYPTSFWHFNKFIARHDSAVYLVGGYGHHTYLNSVYRYHIPSGQWDSLTTTGDVLMPRYLFALGATPEGDTAYLLGGYGNSSGRQIQHPHNVYDLMRFDVKRRSFKKIYELKQPAKDFAFAASMVPDADRQHYYALIFPNYKFDSKLQLVRGSLNKPEYEVLGDEIPYSFLDIASYADLYYCPKTHSFIAVTLYYDSAHITHARVYSLAAPPVNDAEPVLDEPVAAQRSSWVMPALMVLAGLLAAAGLLVFMMRSRKNKTIKAGSDATLAAQPVTATAPVVLPGNAPDAAAGRQPAAGLRSALFLFGEMQLFDKEGMDVTKQLTPILKELFLIIYLYSVDNPRGVSAEKIMEILWPDKPEHSARNNRSVNIAKLKSLLDKIGYVQLLKKDEYNRIEFEAGHFYVDYAEYRAIVADRQGLNKEKIARLSSIVAKGGFLSNLERDWLDPFKSAVSHHIIDTYLQFAGTLSYEEDAGFLLQLSGNIFYFDPLNEHALTIQCKALTQLGKHSLVIKAYEKFTREYKTSYGEEYNRTLPEVLSAAIE